MLEIPINPFSFKSAASVLPPGSKSLTNRAMILAALSGGKTRIEGALFSRDTEIMADCLKKLGYMVKTNRSEKIIEIESIRGSVSAYSADLFVGNAGTAARFITALVCLRKSGVYNFDSDEAMYERPLYGLIKALQSQGAVFDFKGKEYHFPFTVKTCGLKGGDVSIDAGVSSQMLSAMLMVADFAESPMNVKLEGDIVSKPFVKMTIGMMQDFGINMELVDGVYKVVSSQKPIAERVIKIEPDATAASYFAILPAVVGGACRIENFLRCKLQGDAAFVDAIREAELVDVEEQGESIIVKSAENSVYPEFLELDFNDISDTFLTLAAISPILPFKLKITGIAHTRLQETDRVAAVATQLRKLCANVEELEDSITITPYAPQELRSKVGNSKIRIETYQDHRIAMSFSILAAYNLRGDGSAWIVIEDPKCVSKTWAEFFETLYTARGDSTNFRVIAIDGGAAVGKSSVSKECAKTLDYMHVDTGAHYRTISYALMENGVEPTDVESVKSNLSKISLSTALCGNSARMSISGNLVDDSLIRTERINLAVANFAAIPEVREFLKSYQRSMADFARKENFAGMIMEGRDIGSVIFPDANVRIFLDADEETRAARRAKEGISDSIKKRDEIDKSRKTAPLRCPEGAERIDTSHMTKQEVVNLTLALILAS